MKISDFKMQMSNRYCRQCINEMLSTNIEKEDCYYAMYPNQCQKCEQMRNIVENLHWSAQYKILFAKNTQVEE
ncbi:MAG: hypothetical protein J6C01_08390 [Lachnospiraceae bacterium]|nr:hypothetical protein [Lachnospiraceae bacterium]